MEGALNSFPGPVFQRLGSIVTRPPERLAAEPLALGAHLLYRAAMGLGAATGLARVLGAPDGTVGAAAVLALVLLFCAGFWALLRLDAPQAVYRMVRNLDAPLARHLILSTFFGPLLLLCAILALTGAPLGLVEVLVGLDLACLAAASLAVQGAAVSPHRRTAWHGPSLAVYVPAQALALGPLLFGVVWAFTAPPWDATVLGLLLTAGTVAAAASLWAGRRLQRLAGGGLTPALPVLAIAPAPLALVLTGLGAAQGLFLLAASAAALYAVVLERSHIMASAERSLFVPPLLMGARGAGHGARD